MSGCDMATPSVVVPCRRARKCTAAFTSPMKAAARTHLHPLGKGLACILSMPARPGPNARVDGRTADSRLGYRSYSPLEGPRPRAGGDHF